MSTNSGAGNLKRGQPASPNPHADSKKPRRSERVRGKADDSQTASTMSPPSRPDAQRTPASSPPPQETQGSTQVVSQFGLNPFQTDVNDCDPAVWGFLEPLTDPTKKKIRLDKTPDSADKPKKPRGSKKATPSGFLIGRHRECDLHIDAAVISNRHCVIFKEVSGGVSKAVLEDLSSNGTWVNGIIVGRNKRRDLETGDEVEFAGGHSYHFRYPVGRDAAGFHQTFDLGPLLGSGHFASVYTAVEKKTGTSYAVKVFKKRRAEERSRNAGLQQEVAMLMTVSHPNVLCLKGTYVEDDGVYLVLELAPEGELFNYIIQHQKLTEAQTRKVFSQLLNGIKYLHERDVVHRDIKPENILLVDKQLTVKVADFGLAKIIGEDSFTTSLCGTPSYVAPEVLESSAHRRYTRAVDVWSLGVVLYICLCGFPPFSDELYTPDAPYSLSQQIKMGRFNFPSPHWDSIGDPALDLIERMLEVDPDKRITVSRALEHPWMTEGSFNPADSCGNLADAIEGLGFSRKRVKQERTLLSDVVSQQNSTIVSSGQAKAQMDADAAEAATKLDAQTKAFVQLGGEAGDEPLYEEGSFDGESSGPQA